jgi:hypothetical protein
MCWSSERRRLSRSWPARRRRRAPRSAAPVFGRSDADEVPPGLHHPGLRPGSDHPRVTRDWVAALARRCDGVDVIAAAAPAPGWAPPAYASRRSGRSAVSGGPDRPCDWPVPWPPPPPRRGVFVHMVPRLVLLAYPFAALARRPLALWYAQGGLDPSLRLASRLASHILTPDAGQLPPARCGGRPAPDGHRPRRRHRTLRSGRHAAGDAAAHARRRPPLAVQALRPAAEGSRPAADLDWRLRIAGHPCIHPTGPTPRPCSAWPPTSASPIWWSSPATSPISTCRPSIAPPGCSPHQRHREPGQGRPRSDGLRHPGPFHGRFLTHRLRRAGGHAVVPGR